MNEPLGNELSAAARQVIADARDADEPSAEDRARVKARWLAGIAAGAGVSSLSEAVRAAATTGWGLKVGALAAALAAATAGIYLGWPRPSEAPTSVAAPVGTPTRGSVSAPSGVSAPASSPEPQAAVPPAAPSPPLAESTAEVGTIPPEAIPSEAQAPEAAPPAKLEEPQTRAAVRVAAARRPVSAERGSAQRAPAAEAKTTAAEKAPAEPVASGQLGEELSLLSEIRGNLQAGAAARALEQLAESRRRFGQPNLAMEADALQVDALCGAGQQAAARAAAVAFESKWPGSPLQQRVSAACP